MLSSVLIAVFSVVLWRLIQILWPMRARKLPRTMACEALAANSFLLNPLIGGVSGISEAHGAATDVPGTLPCLSAVEEGIEIDVSDRKVAKGIGIIAALAYVQAQLGKLACLSTGSQGVASIAEAHTQLAPLVVSETAGTRYTRFTATIFTPLISEAQ